MRRTLPLTLASLSLLLAAAVGAQDTPTDRYVGRFVLDGSEDAARQRVRAAVRPVIQGLPAIFRGMAEERLESRIRIAREIHIALPEDRIRIRYVGQRSRTLESRRGHPTTIQNEEGDDVRMTQLFRDGHLEQVFEGENGRLYGVLELSADGRRLTARTILIGERLDEPIRIEQPYVRR